MSSSPFPRSRNIYRPPRIDYVGEPPEPSLLDELEIYPMRIIETALAIVNPFHEDTENKDHLLFEQPDLAGPLLFCFVLGAALTLSGGQTRFGFIYGLSAVSIFAIFFIVQLLGEFSNSRSFSKKRDSSSKSRLLSVSEVASVLGYGQLPIVWLALIGICVPLKSLVGVLLGLCAVAMSTRATSAQFCRLIGNPDQRLLLAYPCGLVYLLFMLIVMY